MSALPDNNPISRMEAVHLFDNRLGYRYGQFLWYAFWFPSLVVMLCDDTVGHDRDFLRLGVEEWKKAFEEHKKTGKKAVLFVMTDDTKNCDDVAEYLQSTYKELAGDSTFVIHTKKNGEISEDDFFEMLPNKGEIDDINILPTKEEWEKNHY